MVRVQEKYNSTLFLILATIIIWCFYLAHSNINPYREEISSMNRLESLSLTTLIFSYLLGVLVLADFKENSLDMPSNQEYGPQFFLSVILFGIMLIMNAGNLNIASFFSNIHILHFFLFFLFSVSSVLHEIFYSI